MSAIERAKKHFEDQDVKVIEVAEWGEDDKPLKIYSKPLTLAETSKLYKMSKEDDLTMMAYVLIYKALDDNGEKLFDLGDKNALVNSVDREILGKTLKELQGISVQEYQGWIAYLELAEEKRNNGK